MYYVALQDMLRELLTLVSDAKIRRRKVESLSYKGAYGLRPVETRH